MNDKIKRELKKAINKIIREKHRFPTLLEMCGILEYSEIQTQNYMKALAEDGYLVKLNDWYSYPPSVSPKPSVTVEEPKESIFVEEHFPLPVELYAMDPIRTIPDNPIVPKTRKTRKKKEPVFQEEAVFYGAPVYIIQIIMGIIGIGAGIISVYYTTIWFLEFLPWAFALLLSAIMVGFSIAAFETVILFLTGQVTKSRTAKISIATGFTILWIVVSAFSIVSTIAGQVNKHAQNLQESAKQEVNISGVSWNLIQERKTDIRTRINEYRQQIKGYNNISAGMDNLDSRTANEKTWYETQWRLKKAQESLDKLSGDMDAVRTEEQALLEKSKKSGIVLSTKKEAKDTLNFYEWLSGILDMREDLVQFFLSLFPAVFVDIIAPVGIAISLFLRNKYKKS
jgi:hypothetical protein